MSIRDFLRGLFRPRVAAPAGAAVIAAAAAFVSPWEGMVPVAYLDRIANPPVWTVCYGETRGVQPGDSYTPSECADMLGERLDEFRAGRDPLDGGPTREMTAAEQEKLAELVTRDSMIGTGLARDPANLANGENAS